MTVYEKLARVRDSVSIRKFPFLWETRADALGQICDQTFRNADSPDTIPNVLIFVDCQLTIQELEDLLNELDLTTEDIKVNDSDGLFSDFIVTLC